MSHELAPPTHVLPPEIEASTVLASGRAHPELAESIADSLKLDLAPMELKHHSNGELYVRYEESVRQKDVFIIQSHATNNGLRTEESINEQRYMARAAFGAGARSITIVAPYLGHGRGDRKARGREVIPIADVIEGFEMAKANRIMTVDMHSPQSQAIFRGGSFDHLIAQPLLRQDLRRDYEGTLNPDQCIVVAPDEGSVKNTRHHARKLELPRIYLDKERDKSDSTQLMTDNAATYLGEVAGKTCLMFDDMIDTGGTLVTQAVRLKEAEASEVIVLATHGVFSGKARENLANEGIDRIYVTDTLPTKEAEAALGDKLRVVSVGPMIGRAIYENLIPGGSISALYEDANHM